jgi:hypothetical protein
VGIFAIRKLKVNKLFVRETQKHIFAEVKPLYKLSGGATLTIIETEQSGLRVNCGYRQNGDKVAR